MSRTTVNPHGLDVESLLKVGLESGLPSWNQIAQVLPPVHGEGDGPIARKLTACGRRVF